MSEAEWRLLAAETRKQIATGELPLGAPLPSTSELGRSRGISQTTVRRAISQLQDEGLLVGRPGKGVFVAAKPPEETPTLAELTEEVARLRKAVVSLYRLTGHADQLGDFPD